MALAPGQGKPRDLVSHTDIKDICTDDGLDTMLNILDKEYVRESYVEADEARARYEKCRRMPGQTMEDYFREAGIARNARKRGPRDDDLGSVVCPEAAPTERPYGS